MTIEELADAYGEVSDYIDMLKAKPRPETGISEREAEAVRLWLIAGFYEAEMMARGKRDTGAYRIIYAAKMLANALEAYEDHMRRLGDEQ